MLQVRLTLGQRAMINYLFTQVLVSPNYDEAMMMYHLRSNLLLRQLPEGQLSRARLAEEGIMIEEETARWRWLIEKLRAAFAAGKLHSAYSDFAVELIQMLEPRLTSL
jgi:phosphate-selective porin